MCTQSIKPIRWQDKRMKAISRIVNKKNYLTEYYIEEYYLNAIDSYELTAYMEDNDFNMEIYSPQNLSNENNE